MQKAKQTQTDITAIVKAEQEFRDKLRDIRSRLEDTGFAWYPYESLGSFYELDGVLTGDRRQLLALIAGEPVLDVGCGDGDVAFFLESLGCSVDAIDHPPTNHNSMRGVYALKNALSSSVEIHAVDLDGKFTLPRPRYGMAFVFGLLYHLQNPFNLLETLSKHARYLVLNTKITRFVPGLGVPVESAAVAYLLGERELNQDPTNFWVFSEAALRRLLDRTNWDLHDFGVMNSESLGSDGRLLEDKRAYCVAVSRWIGDPSPTTVLLDGWYERDSGQWRWTGQEFSVLFKNPPAAGGHLTLRFCLPAIIIEELGAITISASANGSTLPPARFDRPGEHAYHTPVPGSSYMAEGVTVRFRLDKALPPRGNDHRTLGIIGISVGLA